MKYFFLCCLFLAVPMVRAADPFIMVIDTTQPGTSAADQFTLPLDGVSAYDFTVDWGDGTSPQIVITAADQTHTYASAGVYAVDYRECDGGVPAHLFQLLQ
jgi:hypothetical protein